MQTITSKGSPLSLQQARLWSFQHENTTYRTQYTLLLLGSLQRDILWQAFRQVVQQHEILHTIFSHVPGLDIPLQVVSDDIEPGWIEVSLEGLSTVDQDKQTSALQQPLRCVPLSLAQGPLMQVALLRLASDRHIFMLVLPALYIDASSLAPLTDALKQKYLSCAGIATSAQEAPLQYVDVASWQNELLLEEDADEYRAFWQQITLDQINATQLPLVGEETLRTRSSISGGHDFAPRAIDVPLESSIQSTIFLRAQELGIAPEAILLACWHLLIRRFTGQDDPILGVASDARQYEELRDAIGLYTRFVPLNIQALPALSFTQYVRKVQTLLTQISERQSYFSWDTLATPNIEESIPLLLLQFEAATWQGTQTITSDISYSLLQHFSCIEPFALKLSVLFSDVHRVQLELQYDPRLFSPVQLQRISSCLCTLLRQSLERPDAPVHIFSLLSPDEEQRLHAALCGEQRLFSSQLLHQRVDELAVQIPNQQAVCDEERALTYQQLAARSSQLAHLLLARGVSSQARVAFCLSRSVDAPLALLAILKAGATYVPMEPDGPPARLAAILQDCQPALLLSHSKVRSQLPDTLPCPVLFLDELSQQLNELPTSAPEVSAQLDDLAYVIYTSGSTGDPKGVCIRHRSLLNYTYALLSQLELPMGTHFGCVSTLAADLGYTAIFGSLLSGGCLHLFSYATVTSAERFAHLLARQPIDVLKIVPSHLRALLSFSDAAQLLPRTHLLSGGEVLPPELLEQVQMLGASCRIFNHYGPTETTIGTLLYEVKLQPGQRVMMQVPLGCPLANVEAYVLDAWGQSVPPGVRGELWLGGPGVAAGYLNRPELTQERFIIHRRGQTENIRLYRTGDLVRLSEDGLVLFEGRADSQVKLRGHRIELSEIEACLQKHREVQACVVILQQEPEQHLVAYVVAKTAQWPGSDALRMYLAQRLPEVMVPARFVALTSLPLTANGKLDRKRLPAASSALPEELPLRNVSSPRDPIEEALVMLWQESLHLSHISIHENFFALGGHSLLAMQLISRIHTLLRVDLPTTSLFEHPTIAELASFIKNALSDEQALSMPPLIPVDRDQPLPLSFAQQRLWFLEQLDPGNTAYNKPFALLVQGELDIHALFTSFQAIVCRHESLRTIFMLHEGEPVQDIIPPSEQGFSYSVLDLSTLASSVREKVALRLVGEEAQQPFDLMHGPLLRVRLLCLAKQEHILLLTMHHIISDGWSNDLLVRELTTLYAAFTQAQPSPLPPLPVQYADYAVWQRRWLQGEILERQLTYWQHQLQQVLPLDLPTDHPRPAIQTFHGAQHVVLLPAALSEQLKTLSRQEGVTFFMTLLAAWQVLLMRYSQQQDIAVGTPIANRLQPEVEHLIGFFVNTLVMRTDLGGDPSFRELLKRVRAVALGAYAHQDIPFEKIVEVLQPERDLSRSPLFQVEFTLQNSYQPLETLGNAKVEQIAGETRAVKFDLALFATDIEQGLYCTLEYNTDLFEAPRIQRLLLHWQTLLEGIVAQPSACLSELPMLSSHELALLASYNQTQMALPAPHTFIHHFADQVQRSPDAIAFVSHEFHLSYSGLEQRASQLASHLSTHGISTDRLVALLLPRSLDFLIAILATFQVGGAYLPLDPAWPVERLNRIIDEAQPALLLTLSEGDIPPHTTSALPVLLLTEALFETPAEEQLPLPPIATGEQLAYVIFTSGSTGRPKGAMVHQVGMLNHLFAKCKTLEMHPQDKLAQTASHCFDISVWQFLAPLLVGGCVQFIPDEQSHDPMALLATIAEAGISLLEVVPSLLQALLTDPELAALAREPLTLRKLIVTGEMFPSPLASSWFEHFPQIPLVNAYGPTECSDDVAQWQGDTVSLSIGASLPIGQALPNTRLFVLDRFLRQVPPGHPGQLFVAGTGLGRGYLHEPALTALAFIPNPFAEQPGGRLYQTGDRVRFLPDGSLEFLERLDEQVKLRGYRIELGEIESLLLQQPGVKECAVIVREDLLNSPCLVGYLALEISDIPSSEMLAKLTATLREQLPSYMVPTHLLVMDGLPRTSNGKLDRHALPAPAAGAQAQKQGTGLSPIEELVAGLWSEVLGKPIQDRDEQFFEAGGHSLLATRLLARLHAVLPVELPLRALFEAPSLGQFAALVQEALQEEKPTALVPLVPIARDRTLFPSFAQQRLWFLDQLEPGSPTFNIPTAVRLDGMLHLRAFISSLEEIVRRHESLRTRFGLQNGKPVLLITPSMMASVHYQMVDLRSLPGAQREAVALHLAQEEAQLPFDLQKGPLLRVRLLQIEIDTYVLLLTMHHIISDGWSNDLLVRELTTLYAAFTQAQPSPLPPLPVQYADYASWQRRWLQGEILERQLTYWQHQLQQVLPLDLPTDHPRPAVQTFHGAQHVVLLPAALSAQLKALSRQEGVTFFMTLLAAWQVLLMRYSQQQDIAVGTPIANRLQPEVEHLIGFFVNTLVIRTDLGGDPSFRELLKRVRAVALGAYAHQDIPFEKVVEVLQPERDLSRSPLFQVAFTLQEENQIDEELIGMHLSPITGESTTALHSLFLIAEETEQGLRCIMRYNTDLFEPASIQRMLRHWQTLLEGIAAHPQGRISELPLLTPLEQEQLLVEWNATDNADQLKESCVHQLVEMQAERTPHTIAVYCGAAHLTYYELNRQSNVLAQELAERAVGPESPVVFFAERDLNFVIALLAIFKAGGIYVPVDPLHPADRNRQVFQQSGAGIVLTTRTSSAALQRLLQDMSISPQILIIEDILEQRQEMIGGVKVSTHLDQLAYILYTSGSTGQPKGVMVEHRGMLNHLYAKIADVQLDTADKLAQNGPHCFDISIWQCFAPLILGGSVQIYKDEIALHPERLLRQIEEDAVTVLQLVPAILSELIARVGVLGKQSPSLTALRWIVPTGDALPTELCRRWLSAYPTIPLLNTYGSTECSDDQCHYPITHLLPEEADLPIASIGMPISNMRAYVLDGALKPLPIGITGELYIGGVGVGRGYLNDPAKTAASFMPDPFAEAPGRRLYKTGDQARRLPNGHIEFIGRVDHQTKLRGFRIELGEIEAVLERHPAVQESIVMAREDVPGDKRLVAYVVQSASYQSEDEQDADTALDTEHIEQYQAIYDQFYGQDQSFSANDSAINLGVWTSSYTNQPFLEEEILENVNDTVQRVLSLRPANVLEVGCGTGLLLFRIAPHCEHYYGVDISDVAIQRLRGQLETHGLSQSKVSLFQRAAHELDDLGVASFDMILINEVIQYFPNVEYLLEVLKNVARLVKPGGIIFIGGSRSFSLLETFHTSIQLHHAPSSLSRLQLQQRIQEHMALEKEFIVDPAFFSALPQYIPQINRVQIQLKGGVHHNEMTSFRYDAILQLGAEVEKVWNFTWLDWREQALELSSIRQRLIEDRPEMLGIKHVPSARLLEDVRAREVLKTRYDLETVEELREALLEEAHQEKGVDPQDLWDIGRNLSYSVEVRWSGSGADGNCNVLFRSLHPQIESSKLRVPVWPEETVQPRPWPDYANNPSKGKVSRRLIPQLRSYLRDKLPDYMMPSAFVMLQFLPLTSNGKVDRRALPAPGATQIELDRNVIPPRNPIEALVVQLWSELLGTERTGIHDNFFETGGHSLLATQLISRIRNALQIELPLRSVFETPTVAGIATQIEHALREEQYQGMPPLVSISRTQDLQLSFSQQRLWFLDQLDPGSAAYNIAVSTRLQGPLQVAALVKSFQELVRRHESLRTHFAERAGEPIQIIEVAASARLDWHFSSLESLAAEQREQQIHCLAQQEAGIPFHLATGPLMRVRLLRAGREEHILLCTMHHSISDGWSQSILIRELVTLYAAFAAGHPSPLPALPIQYADYAAWQRQWLQGRRLEEQIEYWRRQLQGVSPLDLPTDYPRPAVQTYAGAQCELTLPSELSQQLAELSQQQGVTLFMTLLAAFQLVLLRYSGQSDVAVGSLVANRTMTEVEDVIGFFVNTLVLRTNLSGNPTFIELLERVREVCLEAYAHQDVPFEKIVEVLQPERDLSRSPLFQVMFVLQNAPQVAEDFMGLTLQVLDEEKKVVPYDMFFSLEESEQGLQCYLKYNTDLFEARSIWRLLHHWQTLLQALVAEPSLPLSSYSLLNAQEFEALLTSSSSALTPLPDPVSFSHLFLDQVCRTPDTIVVADDQCQLSYLALAQRSTSLAIHMRKQGVGPEQIVALLLSRSLDLLTAMLACFMAGAAYLPLDPHAPPARLRRILKDAQPSLLLTTSSYLPFMPDVSLSLLTLDSGLFNELSPDLLSLPELLAALPTPLSGEQLAYVIYTSGSTGAPKGAMLTQRGMLNHLFAKISSLALCAHDIVAFTASPTFDISVWQALAPLLVGSRVQLFTEDITYDPSALFTSVANLSVSILEVVPSFLAALLSLDGLPSAPSLATLRLLVVTGEAFAPALAQRWLTCYPSCHLINAYGPTECSDDVAQQSFPPLPDSEHRLSSLPIGSPLPNTQLLVLDPLSGQLVPRGLPGHLFISGMGVGRGYLGDPERTALAFQPHPYAQQPGERIYATGDRACWLEDGTLHFLGRLDRQVKLRGFRLELGEIETVLNLHPAIQQGVVRLVQAPRPQLLAYLVRLPGSEEELAEAELLSQVRELLNEQLPAYMHPAQFFLLDALPLTPHGKLDERALPHSTSEELTSGTGRSGAPRTPLQELLAGLWQDVLQLPYVGIHDSFFALGGHSLLATRLLSQMRSHLSIDVPLRTLFQTPTIAALAQQIEEGLRGQPEEPLPSLRPLVHRERLPLSSAQQRLWFLEQLHPGGTAYTIPLATRVHGRLNIKVLLVCFQDVVRRHESLRTRVLSEQGEPFQLVEPADSATLFWRFISLEALPVTQRQSRALQIIYDEVAQPFNLAQGPLMRIVVLQLNQEEHILLCTLHHIISDGWSNGLLMSELISLYPALLAGKPSPLPALPIQYADYAAWQREWLQGRRLEEQIEYWKQQLQGVSPLDLPTDHPHPTVQTEVGAQHVLLLPARFNEQLSALSQRQGVTLFMTLLTAFQLLLGRYSGQSDIAVGTPIANRMHSDIEPLIGFFANTLVLRTNLGGNPRFTELLERVREVCLGAYAHQDVPFEKIVEVLQPERVPGRSPLFQVMFLFQDAIQLTEHIENLRISSLDLESHTAKFDLALLLSVRREGLHITIKYNTDLFESDTIERLSGHWQTLLEGILAEPEQRVQDLPLLTPVEHQKMLIDWNTTQDSSIEDRCIHELFELQAIHAPDAIAIAGQEMQLSYGKLDRRANQLAHYLQLMKVGPEIPVGLCMKRSPEVFIGLLGILKAGGVYVPLDSTYPGERLAFMLRNSQISIVLTHRQTTDMPLLSAPGRHITLVPYHQLSLAALSQEPLQCQVQVDNGAYIIYTSGSTGQPKGVQVPHRGISSLSSAQVKTFDVRPGHRVLQFASPGFDASISEIMMAFSVGATLVLPYHERTLPGQELVELLNEQAITTLTLPPSSLSAMPPEMETKLHTLAVAGEACSAELAERWASKCNFINAYGPTEATVCATMAPCRAEDRGTPAIGRPIINVRTYILDGRMQPVAVGIPGELYIGSKGVARGYDHRPDLTAERFVPDMFGCMPGSRLYRTGDLVRYREDGMIEYLGRIDQQIKLRGYRIELAEIEAILMKHNSVREVVVMFHDDEPGNERLVAYITLRDTAAPPSHSELHRFINEQLPEYMIPALFITLPNFPLTPHGKIDRKQLVNLAHTESKPDVIEDAPRTPIEELIADNWCAVQQIEHIGIYDNFFETGGHSLQVTRLLARIRATLQIDLPPHSVFEAPTVADLAVQVEQVMRGEHSIPPLLPAPHSDMEEIPLSYAQQRLWLLYQLQPDSPAYIISAVLRLQGKLNLSALTRSFEEVVQRHEVLRTVFETRFDRPIQVIKPDAEFQLPLIDLQLLDESGRETLAGQLAQRELQQPFDLQRGPLLRVHLLKLQEQEHVLLLAMHHIVTDGWSLDILVREVSLLYTALLRKQPLPLTSLSIQYADYALWQRQYLQGETLKKLLAYWKQQLEGAVALELPTDYPRAAHYSDRGANHSFILPASLLQDALALSHREGVTLFMTLLTTFQIMLARYTDQQDIVVGTDIANRTRLETEELIGFFVNLLALRTRVDQKGSYRSQLAQVRKVVLDAYLHQDLPFDMLVEHLQLPRGEGQTPLIRVLFVLQNAPMSTPQLPDIAMQPFGEVTATSKFDLAVFFTEYAGVLRGTVTYCTDLFNATTIARLMERYEVLLRHALAEPDAIIDSLEMTTADEKARNIAEKRIQRQQLHTSRGKRIDLNNFPA